MSQANQADLFGEGVYGAQGKPYDPNDEPNPNNPGGLSNNQMASIARSNQRAGVSLDPARSARASAPVTPRGKTVGSNKSVWGDIKKIWTSDPVTTAVLAAPYGIAAAGAAIPAAVGGVGGAGAIPSTAATTGAAQSAAAAAAAGTHGAAAGGGAAAATAATNAAAAGQASGAAAAGAAGWGIKDYLKAAGAGAAGVAAIGSRLGGGSSGSSSAPAAAAAPPGVATNYAPSGGYLRPTVTAPEGGGTASSASQFASLSPQARQSLQSANQFATQGAFQNVPRATGPQASQNPAVAQMFPSDQGQYQTTTQQGVQQQQQLANQFASSNAAATQSYNQQGAAAQNRAAPQIAQPSQANQQSVYNAAGSFQPNTSGVAGIRAATADTSGAGALENFQSTNSQQGVNALYGFRPDETFRSANQLENFQAQNTAEGAAAVRDFRPDQVQADAQALRNFRADQSGINRLNSYADEAQGPSAAQAMLRSQADADKRTMLAISRSGRGGPGAAVNAQRQAITEGGLISAETRGQGAALAAQETDMYKQRQLQALAQAGSLISASEAQRLQGLAQAGSLMSAADAQKLSALQAYGQLKATQDSQQLSAKQSAGQLNANAENMLLGATSNAAQLQGQMDSQRLSGLTSAANIKLQGSAINQQGQIAATNAELQGSAQKLQAMGLQGQLASDMANQSIQVLKANLDASMQQLNLNDTQVRYFAGLGAQRDMASQAIQVQAAQFGVNANQAQQSLNLQYQQTMYNQLNQQQQLEYNYASLNSNNALGVGSQAIQQQQLAQNQSNFNVQQSNQAQQQNQAFWGNLALGIAQL